MPDANLLREAPRDWNATFAALPLERPPGDGWARIAARLGPPGGRYRPAWLAAAAALLLAIALPWRLSQQGPVVEGGVAPDSTISAPADPMATLHAESAQLEDLLELARDDRVASGTAAVFSEQLESQLVSIDGALHEPGLSSGQQLSLWRERVDALRSAVSFESNRRWLAAHGERYDGALVQID